jgi:outer membrane protein TolC
MRKRVLIVFLMIFIIGLGTVNTVMAQALTWMECVEKTRQSNPGLISAREKLTQSGININTNKSNYYPQISGSAGAQTAKSEATDRSNSYSYGISGRQLLFDGLKSQYSVAASSATFQAAIYSYAVTSSNLRLQLRKDFVNLLKAQKLVDITSEIAERRKQSLDLVDLGYEAGREHLGSLMTAQADLAQAEFEKNQALRNMEIAARTLSSDFGTSQPDGLKVEGDLSVYLADTSAPDFEKMAGTVPLLRQLIAQKDASRLGVKSAYADMYPSIYANASASKNGSSWPPSQDQWSAGLNVSVPIFSGGSQAAAAKKSESAYKQSQAAERDGRLSVILTLAEAWSGLLDALGQFDVQQKFLAATAERAKIAEAQYKIGLMSFDNWIIIENDLVNAKKTLLNVQANALLAEANWIQAKGVTLDEE